MPKPKRYIEPTRISISLDGKEYKGSYRPEHQGITLTYDEGGSKWAMLHASPADLLASMMLRELVEEAR